MDSTLCIGIDVSQDWLDLAAYPSGALRRFKTTPAGLRSLVEHCRDAQPRLIAFEASGGYERPLADTLTQADLPFAILNPRNVCYHARSIGVLAKTDRIDAAVIAQFASRNDIQPKAPPSNAERLLSDQVTRRTQLVKDQTREKHHSRQATGVELRSTKRYLGFLKREIAAIEREIAKVIAQDASLRERSQWLQTVPGVRSVLAAALLGMLPELGSLNRGAVGMLAGLAPHARDSGKREGKRFCWGGRANVRTALYMPILAAIQHNPVIRAFYQWLVGRGKQRKVALTACMRKMLTILNAILRDGTVWTPRND